MGLLSGGPTFGGIFISEIWWAYYPVGLLSGGLTYGILRYIILWMHISSSIFVFFRQHLWSGAVLLRRRSAQRRRRNMRRIRNLRRIPKRKVTNSARVSELAELVTRRRKSAPLICAADRRRRSAPQIGDVESEIIKFDQFFQIFSS